MHKIHNVLSYRNGTKSFESGFSYYPASVKKKIPFPEALYTDCAIWLRIHSKKQSRMFTRLRNPSHEDQSMPIRIGIYNTRTQSPLLKRNRVIVRIFIIKGCPGCS